MSELVNLCVLFPFFGPSSPCECLLLALRLPPWLASYRTCSAVRPDFQPIKLLGIAHRLFVSACFSVFFNILLPESFPSRIISHLCTGDIRGYFENYGCFYPLDTVLTFSLQPGKQFSPIPKLRAHV